MKGTLLSAAILLAGCTPAGSATYYVDWANGSNEAAGTSAGAAWKQAPGDPAATGRPAGTTLKPGDSLIFRPGIAYRGTISVPVSGTEAAPIGFSGAGWPGAKAGALAIIDGSDAVRSVAPCPSADACGGAPGWKSLHLVRFDPPATARIALFGGTGLYWLSQFPELDNPFFSDDRRRFAPTSRTQLDDLRQGQLRSAELAQAARSGGELELGFWVSGNLVARRPVLAIEGDILRFDPEGVNFWTNRDGAVALTGSLAGLDKPGRFAHLSPGTIVARLRPEDRAATLSVGNGRPGIDLSQQSHIRISGFDFRNFAGARGKRREGIAVAAFKPGSRDIEIRGNRFGPALLEHGQGIVQLMATENVRLVANRIEDIAFGSGLRTGMVNRRLTVEGNVIRRVGRTAITLFSVEGAVVKGNILADIRGIHGNGITAYLANRDILIEGNCVVGSSRPLTYHGNRTPDVRNGITIRGNILVADPDGQAAISSWGAGTNGVLIEGNVLAGPKMGLLMNQSERDVRVLGNDSSGIETRGPVAADWAVDGNTALDFAPALGGRFDETGCEVPASRLGLKVVRSPG